jgi:hypothetical protein
MRLRNDENTVWTDSQDYGADEILSHPFALAPTVQRAACALPFEGPVPTRTQMFQRNYHSFRGISPVILTCHAASKDTVSHSTPSPDRLW